VVNTRLKCWQIWSSNSKVINLQSSKRIDIAFRFISKYKQTTSTKKNNNLKVFIRNIPEAYDHAFVIHIDIGVSCRYVVISEEYVFLHALV